MKIKKQYTIEEIIEKVLLSLTIIGFVAAILYTINNLNYPDNINIILILPFIFF